MLTELYIRNYLLLPEIRLTLNRGLTVISGETGAGKSILIGAISLIFGDNNAGMEAFEKERSIYLEATFLPQANPFLQSVLQQAGADAEEELILAREINPSGKSAYFINGRKAGVSLLKELKPLLIDFHHQRDQQKLLNTANQLELLDSYADSGVLRSAYAELYTGCKSDLKKLEELKRQAAQQKQMRELYQFQLEELENAKLSAGEDLALQSEFELLSHSSQINELCAELQQSLFENENSIFDQVSGHYSSLQKYQTLNPQLEQAAISLQQALEAMQEAARQLSGISENLMADPERLVAIQNRLDTLNALLYKHKVSSIEALLLLFEERARQLAALEGLETEISNLETKLDTSFACLKQSADQLSALRSETARNLAAELQNNIRALSMPEAIFEIRIDKKTVSGFLLSEYINAVSESGQDLVEFLFSANPGFAPKPLSAVVSGGELSRILLAIKKVLASRIAERLVILDEIDAGIGGKTAEQVAKFIVQLSEKQQVLCITHLAQIAARGQSHLAITKIRDKQRNAVHLQPLEGESRLQEIARMLAGSVSSTAIEHASEILNKINK